MLFLCSCHCQHLIYIHVSPVYIHWSCVNGIELIRYHTFILYLLKTQMLSRACIIWSIYVMNKSVASLCISFTSVDCWLLLCDKVCQWLAIGQWFFSGTSTYKTDRHDITEILLKVALSTINLNLIDSDMYHLIYICNE
jgi:hypothetical protein